MTRLSRALAGTPAATGQTLVLLSAFLALLLVPLGLVVMAVNTQRDTVTGLQAVVQTAAFDAAGALDDSSMIADTPHLASLLETGGTVHMTGAALASYTTPQAQTTAEYRAYQALMHGFAGYASQIAAGSAAGAAAITVLQASPDQPVRDPDGGALYHHPTVCISADVPVALLAQGGLAFTHHLHACAQSAVP